MRYEANIHSDFFLKVEQFKKEKKIPEWIKVPKVYKVPSDKNPYYAMEKVTGQSLYTRYLLLNYFSIDEYNDYKNMNDEAIFNVLEKKYQKLEREKATLEKKWETLSEEKIKFYENMKETLNTARPFIGNLAHINQWSARSEILTINQIHVLKNLENLLKYEWLEHNDLHAKNIMIDNQENIFILDFGESTYTTTNKAEYNSMIYDFQGNFSPDWFLQKYEKMKSDYPSDQLFEIVQKVVLQKMWWKYAENGYPMRISINQRESFKNDPIFAGYTEVKDALNEFYIRRKMYFFIK